MRSNVICVETTTIIEIYTLSLHDALPISADLTGAVTGLGDVNISFGTLNLEGTTASRSGVHTSEGQPPRQVALRLTGAYTMTGGNETGAGTTIAQGRETQVHSFPHVLPVR